MENQVVLDAVSGHQRRNAALKEMLLGRVDLGASRAIDCHFWSRSEVDAAVLIADSKAQGCSLITQGEARTKDDFGWNVELRVHQSVEQTIRPEFTLLLVQIARSRNSIYDGWGTQI